jgi:hypothetical protein
VTLREFIERLKKQDDDLMQWGVNADGSVWVHRDLGWRDHAAHVFPESLDDELAGLVVDRACDVLRLTRDERVAMGLPPTS